MTLGSQKTADKARILVVDDDATIRKVVSIILGQTGYLVDTAQNGEEAIAKSEANFYNLALIDVRLPDMEGTRLLSLLRETTPRMVKIILTGYPVLENAVEAINRGVDGYLTKPVNSDTLLETVAEHLQKQRENKSFTEEKVKEFVETRFKEARAARHEPYQGEVVSTHG
jgi:DNA-binding NtrC family response regulator